MNEKYMAGFLDADGSVMVRARIGACPDLCISVAQKVDGLPILEYAQQQFGGHIRYRHDGAHAELCMRSAAARKCVERLKKYMVLKRHHAERMLELVDRKVVLHTEEEVQAVREEVKLIRSYGADRIPNFPARKWLAGYFDGDGSFSVKICKKTGYAYPTATILAAKNYTVGIVLLQQAFGGRICAIGENALWQLQLSQPSKAKEFLGYFQQHLHLKRGQAYFLSGCAEHNFRDGIKVREAIMALNARQHRLSEPEKAAQHWLAKVDFSIPKRQQGRPSKRQSNPLK